MQQAEYAPNPPPADEVYGWAVVDGQGIRIKTVSDTRRAAIVNYLVTDRGTMVFNDMTDAEIERLWLQYRRGALVEYVTIRRTLADMANAQGGPRGRD